MTRKEDLELTDLDTLVEQALVDSRSADKLRHLLKLDEINWIYFKALYNSKKKPATTPSLRIGANAFPTAIASPELLNQLPHRYYESLLHEGDRYRSISRNCTLWIKKTQGGVGSSVAREVYLKSLFPNEKRKVGSKGTDLFIMFKGRLTSIAELQLLQALRKAQNGAYAKVFFQDIVNNESIDAIEQLWGAPSLIDPAFTYNDIQKKITKFSPFGKTQQGVLPTIDEKGKLSLNRLAPGGHAFFAVDTLISAMKADTLPPSAGPLVSFIGNGEDLGSSPDAVIVGWMVENRIPLVMLTTEKTEADLKGGQIALVKEEGNFTSIALIEQVQARQSGQLDLFEKIGLSIKNGGQHAFFNTNIALFNHSELTPRLLKLREKVGDDGFLKIITPALIENKKQQIDSDGKTRSYFQLEGAMGSTLLNLDRAWRQHYSEPLVHFVNIEKSHRTRFFSPIKTAFDFYMLFYSDRFTLDQQTMRLMNQRIGFLPAINLLNPYYDEVENVLNAFKGTKILKLNELKIEGQVQLPTLTLEGRVHIFSDYKGVIDLSKHLATIKDQKVIIDAHGQVQVEELRKEKD